MKKKYVLEIFGNINEDSAKWGGAQKHTQSTTSLIPFSTSYFKKTTLATKVDLKIGSIKDTSFDRFPSKNNFLSKSCMYCVCVCTLAFQFCRLRLNRERLHPFECYKQIVIGSSGHIWLKYIACMENFICAGLGCNMVIQRASVVCLTCSKS